jgi:DNA adenine methylase
VNLVEAYVAVRDELPRLVELLGAHKAAHSEEHYYAVRDRVPATAVERAARVIYLNRTCFNGLYRENSKGRFNVPMGRYVDPPILDEENLRWVQEALQGVEISVADFGEVERRVRPGDFVYFDPPYDPVSATSSFTAYAKGGFGVAEQTRLRDLARRLDAVGVGLLLSNSMTPLVRELYAGFDIATVLAGRNVNSKGSARGKVEEALVRGPFRPLPG